MRGGAGIQVQEHGVLHHRPARAEASDVVVEVDLPFAAMMFKEKAEKAIAKNIGRVLEAPSPSGRGPG